ncbi:MAG: recombination and strand exchange inhibitor protein [Acidobacteria bacterium]|nr:recombination and strand exchange inhibitor protein [Acidobacteriota bacterium]
MRTRGIDAPVVNPTPALTSLELDRVLTLIAMEAKSSLGKDAIAARRPLPTLAACIAAQSELAEMVRFYLAEGLLPLAGLTDVAPLFQRESVLDLEESWQIVRAIRATQAIRETFVRTESYPRLTVIATGIPNLGELLTKTNKYFTSEGKLREEASAELRSIRTRIHAKRNAIQKTLVDVMNRNADAIQEPLVVMRGDRYCIPVRSDHRNAVQGILHERSGSGASFFIEPMAAIELNNDLAELMIQEREEIARITRYMSQLLFDEQPAIRDAVAIAGGFDALQACAVFHETVDATLPTFNDDHVLHIIDGRHPLLDERLANARAEMFDEEPSERKAIPMGVELNRQRTALVVSGPNAGGKTVALKTTGLLIAMAMSGLPVPAAEGTIIPFIDSLHVLIGDDQSVLEHLSTFSAYLVRLKRVLDRATERSLVLLDELGSGSEPEEGSALAAAVIENLLERGSLMIVTTHLSALKSFAVNDTRIVNASMEFDSATGQPTYRMIAGIPGRSRAIDVAKMIGLPDSVIASARERLGDRYGETDHLLSELQKRMSEVLAQRDEAATQRREAERERATLAEKAAALEKERARVGSSYREELERFRDDVTRQLSAEIKHLRDLDRSAREKINPNEVLKTVTKPVERAIEFVPAESTRPVRVGDKVEHRKFKVKGDVVSIDGQKAVLNANGKKMTVDLRDLVAIGGPAPAPTKRPQVSTSESGEIGAELNLVGQRVDDAIEASDRFLDRALLEGKSAVRIIHGFGTGTLRKALREYLRKHPAVKSWRPGGDNEGGDGATVAVLE